MLKRRSICGKVEIVHVVHFSSFFFFLFGTLVLGGKNYRCRSLIALENMSANSVQSA